MLSFVLCIFAFAATVSLGRRSLIRGLSGVVVVGYLYGIVRANALGSFSHFIFDASVLGLYASMGFKAVSSKHKARIRKLEFWVLLAALWPILMFLVPAQDTLIQLVGLRGSIFFLPFLLIGARLDRTERVQLALCLAFLNLAALLIAGGEFFWGLEAFMPRNPSTYIIYLSKDVSGFLYYRIPAGFSSGHAYGGTMLLSLPLIIGALFEGTPMRRMSWHKYVLLPGAAAALLGIFLCAARTPLIFAIVLMLVLVFSLRWKFAPLAGWAILLVAIGIVASSDERLQRFASLQDTDYVSNRIGGSVNMGFVEVLYKYPLGNGLGGGGTSVPYFLEGRLKDKVVIESEYARLLLEHGIPGLLLWVGFIAWMLTRRPTGPNDPWMVGRRLAWFSAAMFFGTGLIGIGLFTSIPATPLLFIYCGWISAGWESRECASPTVRMVTTHPGSDRIMAAE